MKKHNRYRPGRTGFTIVELLVVIVVIGILAAVTIVSYTGIQQRARAASLQNDLSQAVRQLEMYKTTNSLGQYPADLATASLKQSSGNNYSYNTLTAGNGYCLNINNGNTAYFVTSSSGIPAAGTCNGLIGWWPLNGNGNDQSGNGKDGTIYGATFATGYNGSSNGALSFNGVNNYMNITSFDPTFLESSSFGASWTLSIWTKWGGNYNEEGVIMGKEGCNGGFYGFSYRFVFAIKGSECWTGAQSIYGSVMDSTSWHFLVGTYQAGTMAFYEDGTLQGTATLTNMYTEYGDTLGIGSGGWSNWEYNGLLDDARVYNRALSASEVSNLYSAGAQ
jgi:prepilin-type N-terminal cleavage/methylation domain-containing protein